MMVLDQGDDSWNVVLVDARGGDEFPSLCEQLGMAIMEEEMWA